MQPISFLPKDEITPAIQNLGESLSKINESKIARKGEQIKSFQGLLDVSLQGVKNGHYGETTADLDKLTQAARDIYVKAENENRPVNYKESLELSNQKKSLLYKVNTSKMLMDDYQKAMIKAAELEKEGKLDPAAKVALDNWLKSKDPIETAVFPSTLLSSKLNETEISALLNATVGKADATKDFIDTAKGHIDTEILTPQRIRDIAAVTWDNSPQLQRSLPKNEYIQRGVQIYEKSNRSLTERVSNTTNIKNEAGGKPKYKFSGEKVGNETYHDFSSKAVPTVITGPDGTTYKGSYSIVKRGSDGSGEVFVTQIVDNAGSPVTSIPSMIKIMPDAKADPNRKGGVWLPYTQAVENNLQANDFDTEVFGVTKKSGYTAPGNAGSGKSKAGGKPKTVVQNGYTYALDEETGEYK